MPSRSALADADEQSHEERYREDRQLRGLSSLVFLSKNLGEINQLPKLLFALDLLCNADKADRGALKLRIGFTGFDHTIAGLKAVKEPRNRGLQDEAELDKPGGVHLRLAGLVLVDLLIGDPAFLGHLFLREIEQSTPQFQAVTKPLIDSCLRQSNSRLCVGAQRLSLTLVGI